MSWNEELNTTPEHLQLKDAQGGHTVRRQGRTSADRDRQIPSRYSLARPRRDRRVKSDEDGCGTCRPCLRHARAHERLNQPAVAAGPAKVAW